MAWYSFFSASVVLLWALASPKDRNALRVILVATVASMLITGAIMRQIPGTWKLVVPATVETLTILALLRFAPNRTGCIQAALLVVAWFTHVLCYYDLQMRTDLVYTHYEEILCVVGVGQLVACHDTVRHNLAALRDWAASILGNRTRGIHTTGVPAAVSHRQSRPGVQ